MTPDPARAMTCQAPDRDSPRLVCGYPLPCPHHNFKPIASVAIIVNRRRGKDRRMR